MGCVVLLWFGICWTITGAAILAVEGALELGTTGRGPGPRTNDEAVGAVAVAVDGLGTAIGEETRGLGGKV